jgi:hypothetical protein
MQDAMITAVHEDIDAGIIDINLGGDFVYPVADVLVARNIPFVFVTGYGVESVEPRFARIPIIKKPVQRQILQKLFVPSEDTHARPGVQQVQPQESSRASAVG